MAVIDKLLENNARLCRGASTRVIFPYLQD